MLGDYRRTGACEAMVGLTSDHIQASHLIRLGIHVWAGLITKGAGHRGGEAEAPWASLTHPGGADEPAGDKMIHLRVIQAQLYHKYRCMHAKNIIFSCGTRDPPLIGLLSLVAFPHAPKRGQRRPRRNIHAIAEILRS